MRRIKFKAWDKVNKRFIVDYTKILPAHYNGSKYPDQGGVDHNVVYVQTAEYETDCELLLFTGLKDMNGKEIYEGDIVQQRPPNVAFHSMPFRVEWDQYTLGFVFVGRQLRISKVHFDMQYCKVIGNVFENPELLDEV